MMTGLRPLCIQDKNPGIVWHEVRKKKKSYGTRY